MKPLLGLLLSAIVFTACAPAPSTGSLAAADGLPENFDWTNPADALSRSAEPCADVVKKIKNNGECFASTAMALSDVIRDRLCIQTAGHVKQELSAQQIMNCIEKPGQGGCNDALPDDAIEYVKTSGLCSEQAVPCLGREQMCRPCQAVVRIESSWPPKDVVIREAEMKREIFEHGPIVAVVEADRQAFISYKSGILPKDGCGTQIDHAVRVVGWGTQNGRQFWKLANNWGTDWGDAGYILISREENASACGLNMLPVAPILTKDIP